MQPKTGNASAAPPVAEPSPSSSSPGEAASINLDHHPRHQVKPRRRHLHLRVPPQTLVPPLRLHLRLLLCPRALTVLEDDRSPCLDSRQGSSRRPSAALAPLKAETCGSAHPRKRRKGSPRRMAPLARRGRRRNEEGGRRTDAGRACCRSAAWCLSCSYNPQARGQAGPITRVAAGSTNGRYIARSGVCQRYPAYIHESLTW